MNIPMTVMKIDNGVIEFVIINLRDVDFIETEKNRKIAYHIGDEKFYQATTKSELEELLTAAGFDTLDRPYLVNMKKIRYFDKQYGKVYFVDQPTPKSKFVTVAKVKEAIVEKFIKHVLNEQNDLSNELHLEQSGKLQKWFTELKGILK